MAYSCGETFFLNGQKAKELRVKLASQASFRGVDVSGIFEIRDVWNEILKEVNSG